MSIGRFMNELQIAACVYCMALHEQRGVHTSQAPGPPGPFFSRFLSAEVVCSVTPPRATKETLMKTVRLCAALALVVVSLGAGIQDYLAELKTSMHAVEGFVQDAVAYGNFNYPSACAKIPASRRAAIVRAAGEFARAFTATPGFVAWYDGFREERKPSAPTFNPTVAESRAQQVDAIKKQIAETEKSASAAPADQKGMYKDVLASLKAALKEIESGDKSRDGEMDALLAQSNQAAKQDYETKLAAYEREYPKGNPRPLIRKHLEEFLEVTKDVDFDAKLVKKDNLMVFANPEYEQKPSEWKKAFRAGKAAAEAERAFALDWLKSLK